MPYTKTAYDISRKKVFFCNMSDSLSFVAKKMFMNNIGSILVESDDKTIGIITVNDMLRQISKNSDQEEILAKDIMSTPVIMVNKDIDIDNLVDLFNTHKVSRMILLDKSKKVVAVVRDIAVHKCITYNKYHEEVKNRFAKDYMRQLY